MSAVNCATIILNQYLQLLTEAQQTCVANTPSNLQKHTDVNDKKNIHTGVAVSVDSDNWLCL